MRMDFVGVGLQPRHLGMTEVMHLQEPERRTEWLSGSGNILRRGCVLLDRGAQGVSAAPRLK